MLKYSIKGIGPVVAVVLLLSVTLISVMAFHFWFEDYKTNIFSNAEVMSNERLEVLTVEDLVDNFLYVRNNVENNLTIIKLQINNLTCNLCDNLSLGMNILNVSDCLTGLTSRQVNVVLITSDRVVQKTEYIK